MERLFRRYPAPEKLLGFALKKGRLCGMLDAAEQGEETEFMKLYYLTRVFDRSYDEFLEAIKPRKPGTAEDTADIVSRSREILEKFNGKEKKHGTL